MASTTAKQPARKAAPKAAGKKVAATVAAGGGPEDPITDALALAEKHRAAKKQQKADRAAAKGPNIGGSTLAAGNKMLLAEFVLCFVILSLGTIVAPQGSKDGVPRLISRGSGLCLLFFVLALVAGVGPGSKRVAGSIGGLVTLSYLLTSSDANNVLTWITGFYSKAGVTPTASASAQAASGVAGAAAGAAGAGGATANIGGVVGELAEAAAE
jgi:hypothetical protein